MTTINTCWISKELTRELLIDNLNKYGKGENENKIEIMIKR